MEHYRRSSHTVYDLKFHLVWITKYRKPVLTGEVASRMRELVREVCKARDVEILKGHISREHVHIFVSVPPQLSISELMKSIKGRTSRRLQEEFDELRRRYWGQHLWSRGYFCASAGAVTDEMIREYVERHEGRGPDPDFRVEVPA